MVNINNLLFLDIETVGIAKDFDSLVKTNPDLAELWRKNEVTLKKFNPEDVNISIEDLFAKRSGLYPEFSKIVCFSYGLIKGDKIIISSFHGHDEQSLLRSINKVLNRAAETNLEMCGLNIKFFDIPFIGKRMFMNGIKPSGILPSYDTKPWDVKAVDIKDVYTFGTSRGLFSLETIAVVMGLPNPKAGDVKADSVHDAYWNKDGLNSIKEYCEKDVNTTIQLMIKLNNLT